MTSLNETFRWNDRLATITHHIIASLMICCVVISLIQFVEYLIPAFHGGYLVVVCWLIALESMYSHRVTKSESVLSPEWLLYRGTEWVVLLIALKIVIYAVRDFSQVWLDIPLWRQDFVANFFDAEYLFAIFLVFITWSLAGMFAQELSELEGDEKLLGFERDGYITSQRPAARRNLANMILILGGVLIFLAALIRLDLEAIWGQRVPFTGSEFNILAYFFLSLILLSLTQFAILRVNWSLERIPIHRNLASRWLVYSAVTLLILTLIAIILPTHYSIGFLNLMGYLISLIIGFLNLVILILSIPFLLLFSILSSLFGSTQPVKSPDFSQVLPPPPPANATSVPWAEMLKSLIFWAVFVAIILFSLYQFFKQNGELVHAIRRIPVLGSMLRAWSWLWNWLRGVNQKITSTMAESLRRLRERQEKNAPVEGWQFLSLRRMSPRQRVIFFYLAMVRRSGERGLPRQPAQTPNEYARVLTERLPDVQSEVGAFTDGFNEARYSRHEIGEQNAGIAQRYWQRIKHALRERFSME
jgi:hypothetical protein